jgi:hypothetical protein
MLNLENRKWKDFNLIQKNMYQFFKCKTLPTTNLEGEKGILDIVGATTKNNGNVFFANKEYKKYEINKNVICLIKTGQGSVGEAVYKGNNFIPSNNVVILKKNNLNIYTGLFTTTLINKCSDRYSYGYIRNDKRIKREKNMYPISENQEIDWLFMEQYTKSKIHKKIEDYKKYAKNVLSNLEYKKIEPLENKEWEEFFLTEIFSTIQRGRRLTKSNQKLGNIPYVSSTSMNNGVDNFIGNKTNVRIFSDCLTIANSGSVGASFYQPYKFVGSDHITHLKKENMSKYVYLFISTLTNRFSQKYNFNREINDARISREKIMLPINEKNEPDFEYMEQYMKNLTYTKIHQYLNYLQKQI